MGAERPKSEQLEQQSGLSGANYLASIASAVIPLFEGGSSTNDSNGANHLIVACWVYPRAG